MTSKKGLVLYFSATGNTKEMLKFFNDSFNIVDIKKAKEIDFGGYEIIIFGTSTWGKGLPPRSFLKYKEDILSLTDKKIGLFGSGRSEYTYYCGALDVLEDMTKEKNEILFKYKFEGYPRDSDFLEFEKLINKFINEMEKIKWLKQ